MLFSLKLFYFFFAFLPLALASGQPPSDSPDNGETFAHFFTRISSGGQKYSGISFDAPLAFQQEFLTRFKTGAWVGDQNKISRELSNQGVNLWGEWYVTETPLNIVLGNTKGGFSQDFEEVRGQECSRCRTLLTLQATPWKNWTVPERALWTRTYVMKAKIFGGHSLVDYIAENYSIKADTVLAGLTVKILEHADFVKTVRELGWSGEVYFRGITAPLPSDPAKEIIALDGDFLRDKTENTAPLFQMLEYAGILVHEINHVFQDMEAKQMGLDLSISSPEGVLLIEGSAEYLAEQAMSQAAATLSGPSALKLYVSQQAIGLMDKDASANYAFFPYRVGLPFAYSLYRSAKASPSEIREKIYQTILGKESLTGMVEHLFQLQNRIH